MVDATDIIRYEEGELSMHETVDMFANMIKDGSVWQLQGSYGRMAIGLIEAGYISKDGEVLNYYNGEGC